MERVVGTVVRGLRGPIINKGDNIEEIVVNTVLNTAKVEGFSIKNRDIVTITESVVARAQGNYATIDDIATDIKSKFGEETIGVTFPILSRNRFANCLKGIAKGTKNVVLMLSYPSDEVGNHLVDIDDLDTKGINPWTDVLSEADFRKHFGYNKHRFTGVDYIDYYKSLIEAEGANCEVIFSNNAKTILDFTKNVLTCDIHSRFRTKRILTNNGAKNVFGLDDILNESINGSGFNEAYGLLGSNKATEDSVKLFPNNCQPIVDSIQAKLKEETGKTIEVMVYGDGAFKDPVGKIWELADPVVSPGYTAGLDGTPNEVKLKYLADNNFSHLRGKELKQAISEYIQNKNEDLVGAMEAQGTTPRRLTDLIGSLSDLTSGSGDKGTPMIYIQGYFDNYTK
ncbi:F420-0:Gamma-glutamyl ligase [Schinkia azotoformans MEV2011]|uniref:F420-0:Gamma-glutamyl ligase n=1 Tax=Schinkia azotoformans MEV2011 TaxID=1348973 RepID=A0A072NF39_SCHAZ|nr:coenzyme F420-0:L-glutamate ligase [Schinkia azotoformans]KEF36131.1 F420-0:Gamma-glutamyl ligase [Schinkia azotoformans MEV2011]MEC1696274.1 coenzyme F420-0:L-glutamate ligase [Schinkia azotoformans]MEC1727132.1 coenzyme F420-0:L-glutamate ligase [Schinkia azotoformans]MEC1771774.1 coenzyme F420-0:L-glutamate ligase [Schinkia azotoformans]MED4367231.1 coenzyme F420-0:L-glutamate ligase [Schinkia azotoformans]